MGTRLSKPLAIGFRSDDSYVHRYSQNAIIFSKRVSVFETEARESFIHALTGIFTI